MRRRLVACGVVLIFFASCNDNTELVETRVADLNERIDQLALTEKELEVEAKTLDELEAKVIQLEEARNFRLRDTIRREEITKRRIRNLELEMEEMGVRIQNMKKSLESYANKDGEARKRIDQLIRDLDAVIDLGVRADSGEETVKLLERLLTVIEELEEENKTLRSELGRKL